MGRRKNHMKMKWLWTIMQDRRSLAPLPRVLLPGARDQRLRSPLSPLMRMQQKGRRRTGRGPPFFEEDLKSAQHIDGQQGRQETPKGVKKLISPPLSAPGGWCEVCDRLASHSRAKLVKNNSLCFNKKNNIL